SVVDLFLLFFSSFVLLHTLHSFPTRRSSDLYDARIMTYKPNNVVSLWCIGGRQKINFVCHKPEYIPLIKGEADLVYKKGTFFLRSEEHTSELQSRENLVCRLLLEKKKKKKII